MATIADLEVRIGADIKRLEKGISRAQRKLKDAGRSMQRAGRSMTMAITAPLAGAGAAALRSAAQFESLQQSMSVLNGSAEEGARNFERLKEFSAGTPFQLKGLARAQNMLQGFGLSADKAFESMSMIGDIAAISGGSIQGIGIAFGQAAAEGRLMTRDIRQLINQGVPAIKLLADTMGVAKSEVLDLASEGEISFEILQEAFRDATTAGGMFANGMEKQAQTLMGIWSTFKDNVSIALADVGQAMAEAFDLKGLADSVITTIQNVMATFNNLSDETQRMAFYIAGLLGASGPILVALGTLTAALGAISWPVVLGVTAIAGAVGAIISNWDEIVAYFTTGQGAGVWDTIRDASQSLFISLKGLFKSATSALKNIWDLFGDEIVGLTKASFTVIKAALQTGFDTLALALDVFTGRWATNWDAFWNDNENRVKRFAENAESIITDFLGVVEDRDTEPLIGTISLDNLFAAKDAVSDIPLIFKQAKNPVQGFWDTFEKRAKGGTGVMKTQTQIMIDNWRRLHRFLSMDFNFADSFHAEAQRMIEAAKKTLDFLNNFSTNIQAASIESPLEHVEATPLSGMKAKIQKQGNQISKATKVALAGSVQAFDQQQQKMAQKTQMMSNAMGNAIANMATAFAEGIGKIIAGTASLADVGTGLLKLLADMAIKIGSLFISLGAAVAASLTPDKLIASGGTSAIIAGGALVAAGAALRAILSSTNQKSQDVPEMAQGGLAFGPTMAVVGDNKNARSNPEVIAPLDKLKGMIANSGGGTTKVEGIIRGSDIHLANQRGQNKFR